MDHPGSQSTSTKVERRIIEKNRRDQMKQLHSKLNSLLPLTQNSKEALPLPDQIEEAINYIKSLEINLNKSKEKKDSLLGKKRSSPQSCTNFESSSSPSSSNPPQIKIREMGSSLEVVLTTGVENRFLFYEVINIFHEERVDILHASYSVLEDSGFHIVHGEIGENCMYEFGAAKISERLKRLVNASASDIERLQPEWWDFEIHDPDQTWDFQLQS